MDTKEPAAPDAAEKVLIFHTGNSHGPMETAEGVLRPGQSLLISSKLAKVLVAAYRHIKLAADVFPGGAQAAEKAAALQKAAEEKASALEGEIGKAKEAIADLVKLKDEAIARAKAAEDKLAAVVPADVAALQATVADLQGRLKDFLEADSKKALEALQEKHADAVPAAPAA